MKHHIPNALTLANLFCGCCALVYTLNDQPETAVWFTLASFVFDYTDGLAARALGVTSPLGKELDSLADVISFGAVPGAMLFVMLSISLCGSVGTIITVQEAGELPQSWSANICLPALGAFILTAFSAFRLGKFNLDTRQTEYFLGLSTPACTIFVLGLRLTAFYDHFGMADWILNPIFLYGVVIVFSYLLTSEIPMFGMKIKRFNLRSNGLNLIMAAVFAILVIWVKHLALSVIVLIYIMISFAGRRRVNRDSFE